MVKPKPLTIVAVDDNPADLAFYAAVYKTSQNRLSAHSLR